MSALPRPRMTVDEYLAREATAEIKSEWINGEAYAMSGASPRHNHVALRAGAILGAQAWPRGCHVAVADQRVQIDATGAWVYPDVTLACEAPRYDGKQPLSLLNPQLLIEVASPTTSHDDRTWKWEHYRRIPSLQAYILLDPRHRRATIYERRSEDTWQIRDAEGDATALIGNLDLALPLSELFAGLDGYPDDAASG